MVIQVKKTVVGLLIGLSLALLSSHLIYAKSIVTDEEAMLACVAEASRTADDNVAIGVLKRECNEKIQHPIKKRMILERNASSNPFAIIPHKPNYMLPVSYFNAEETPYTDVLQGNHFDHLEAKFQVSIKYAIAEDVWNDNFDLYAAFTSTSWWQSYNSGISAVFRETNYEPELILAHKSPWSLLGLEISHTTLAFSHQSNGQAGTLSRSWNRLVAGFTVVDDNIIWNLKAWYRIPEDVKLTADSPSGDDNPNIEHYMGYGELGVLWKINDSHNIDVFMRNNLKRDNKGAFQIGWSFPLSKHLRGYVEYFNGYGESLIYYNEHVSRLGIGVKLTDWL